MAMMDRVIGRKGCSFSAMIALKLFGDKKRGGMKKDMDFDEALDDMLTKELEEDDLEKPFKQYVLEVFIIYIQKLIQD